MEAITASDSNVLGHYCRAGNNDSEWQPVLGEATSTPLFTAVVEDSISTVETYFERDLSRINAFFLLLYWGAEGEDEKDTQRAQTDQGPQKVQVKPRTLAMIAAYHGSLRVLAFFLSKGADPRLKTPDGLFAADFALAGKSPHAPTVRAMLEDAASNFAGPSGQQLDPVVAPPAPSSAPAAQQGTQQQQHQLVSSQRRSFTDVGSLQGMHSDRLVASPSSLSVGREAPALSQEPSSGAVGNSGGGASGEGDPYNPDSLPYSTAELTRPEYSTDTFRMFCFKVLRCSKRYAHDWRACPFAHPTENARRRDPREFQYCSVACPDYKQGCCLQGDACQYAHGVFECWLHPSRYRTQLCKDGAACRRPVCFFAHTLAELRTPTHMFVPGQDDRSGARSPAVLTPSPIGPGPIGGAPDYTQLAAAAAAAAEQPPQPPQAFSPDAYSDAFPGGDQNSMESLLQQHQQHAAAVAAAGIGGSEALLDASLGGPDVLGRASGGPDVAIGGLSGLPMAAGRGGGVDQGQGGASPHKQLAAAAAAAGQYSTQQHMPPPGSQQQQHAQQQQQPHVLPVPHMGMQQMQHVAPPYLANVPAPRMSNAFARRHGLNPKDSPIVNLQRIALAHHPGPLIPAYYGHPGMPADMNMGMAIAGPSSSSGASGSGSSSSRGRHHRKGSHHGATM